MSFINDESDGAVVVVTLALTTAGCLGAAAQGHHRTGRFAARGRRGAHQLGGDDPGREGCRHGHRLQAGRRAGTGRPVWRADPGHPGGLGQGRCRQVVDRNLAVALAGRGFTGRWSMRTSGFSIPRMLGIDGRLDMVFIWLVCVWQVH